MKQCYLCGGTGHDSKDCRMGQRDGSPTTDRPGPGMYWNDVLECWQDEPTLTPKDILKRRKRNYDQERYYSNHSREVARASEGCRRRAQAMFTPPWADKSKIEAIYAEAARRRANGEDVVVDHEIPVRGKCVTGFHVETNLRIITRAENLAKGNRHPDA